MIVKPMLGEWEVPRLAGIEAIEQREFAELQVPGRVGSIFQDLNSAPTRLAIRGSLHGDDARNEFLEAVRERFRAGEPVSFVADILTATEVEFVVIESMYFDESAERPDELEYLIVVRESPPPPPPPDLLGGLDLGLLDQAAGFLDTITGALDVLGALGSIPDIGNPTPPLTSALDSVTSATAGLEDTLAPLRAILGTDD